MIVVSKRGCGFLAGRLFFLYRAAPAWRDGVSRRCSDARICNHWAARQQKPAAVASARNACRLDAGGGAARPPAPASTFSTCSATTGTTPPMIRPTSLQQGPYFINRKAPSRRRKEVRGSRPPAPLFGMGAQVAADGAMRIIRPANTTPVTAARRYVTLHPGSPERPTPISRRLFLLRANPRCHPRPGAHRTRAGAL